MAAYETYWKCFLERAGTWIPWQTRLHLLEDLRGLKNKMPNVADTYVSGKQMFEAPQV